jgi:hypothetical protein
MPERLILPVQMAGGGRKEKQTIDHQFKSSRGNQAR